MRSVIHYIWKITAGKIGLFALVLVFFLGCSFFVKSTSIRYDNIVRDAKPDSYPIEIIRDAASIARPYITIGLVQASTQGLWSRNLDRWLQKEARKLGGDALINLQKRPQNIHSLPDSDRDPMLKNDEIAEKTDYVWVADVIVWELKEH